MNNIILFFKFLVGATLGLFSYFTIDIKRVNTKSPDNKFIEQLQQFESSFVYPLSDNEVFTIRHGVSGDYFGFFKQLGEPYYYVALSKKNKIIKKMVEGQETTVTQQAGEIAAAMCGILRTVHDNQGKKIQVWYICDLKVNQKYQGQHLPLTIIKKIALPRFTQCPRGFAICMNPINGDPKAASIFKKHSPISGIKTQTLNLYTLSAKQVRENSDYLKACLMRQSYMSASQHLGCISTSGVKDYEITNTATSKTRSWQLFHLKPMGSQELCENGTYMICAVDGTPLDNEFKKVLVKPSSTAQIVSYGMENVDFNFLTSDQI